MKSQESSSRKKTLRFRGGRLVEDDKLDRLDGLRTSRTFRFDEFECQFFDWSRDRERTEEEEGGQLVEV